MNLEEIRNKYKTILQEKDQCNSETQWEEAYSTMKNKRKNKILTQISSNEVYAQANKIKKHAKKPSQQVILGLKEKLAQTLQNTQLKNSQIQCLENQIKKRGDKIQQLQNKNQSLHQQIVKRDFVIQTQKHRFSNFQKQYQNLCDKMNGTQIDNDLLRNQMEFYRAQIQNLRFQVSLKDKQLDSKMMEFNKTNKIKKQNQRLRDDIRRLHFLINGIQGFRGISTHLTNKHFLGKPERQYKEVQYWYSADIINEVEAFLKRQEVAYGNKQFTSNLIKFVNRFINKTQKCTQKKVKKKCAQKVKQVQRRHNYSLNIEEVQDLTLKKSYRTLNNSLLYKTATMNQSRANSIALTNKLKDSQIKYPQPRMITQSFVIDRLSKSLINQTKKNHTKQIYLEILLSFKSAIQKLFLIKERQICMKKMKKLVDWLEESLLSVLQSDNGKKCKLQKSKLDEIVV